MSDSTPLPSTPIELAAQEGGSGNLAVPLSAAPLKSTQLDSVPFSQHYHPHSNDDVETTKEANDSGNPPLPVPSTNEDADRHHISSHHMSSRDNNGTMEIEPAAPQHLLAETNEVGKNYGTPSTSTSVERSVPEQCVPTENVRDEAEDMLLQPTHPDVAVNPTVDAASDTVPPLQTAPYSHIPRTVHTGYVPPKRNVFSPDARFRIDQQRSFLNNVREPRVKQLLPELREAVNAMIRTQIKGGDKTRLHFFIEQETTLGDVTDPMLSVQASLMSLYTFFSPTFVADTELKKSFIQEMVHIFAKFRVLQSTPRHSPFRYDSPRLAIRR